MWGQLRQVHAGCRFRPGSWWYRVLDCTQARIRRQCDAKPYGEQWWTDAL